MAIELKNKNISLVFHKPEEGYSGTRFSRIGKLIDVKFQNISMATSELKSGISVTHGVGFYNEFDIETALDFGEVAKGEWFHKIGVGLLRKVGNVYDFMRIYEERPAVYTTSSEEDSIAFSCFQKEYNGFSYELTQVYKLNENGFEILLKLKNVGSKSIKTTEYNHNFIQVSKEPIGNKYKLNFIPEATLSSNSEFVNPNNVVSISAEGLTFMAQPETDFFLSNLKTKEGAISWELMYDDALLIKATTNKIPTKMNIWGVGHVISPELFVDIAVEPGEEKKWKRSYTFHKRLY